MSNLPQKIEYIRGELDIFGEENPASVVNLVTDMVKKRAIEAQLAKPEYFRLDERELYDQLGKDGLHPNPTDNLLRLRFWAEYDKSMVRGSKKIVMANVIGGICSKEYFYGRYLKDPSRVAWMLCPMISYESKMKEALDVSIMKMRKIMDLDPWKNGKLDTKLLDIQIKLMKIFDDRVSGGVVQKSIQTNVNLNADAVDSIENISMEQLRERVKDAKRKREEPIEADARVLPGGASAVREDS